MASIRAWFALAVVLASFTASGLQTVVLAQDGPNAGTSLPSPQAKPPELKISCLLVRDRGLISRLFDLKPSQPSSMTATGMATAEQPQTCLKPALPPSSQVLVGNGDLELLVDRGAYQTAVEWEQKSPTQARLVLYINGMALARDAQLIAVEHLDAFTHMRYQIRQGPESMAVFSSLYRDQGLLRQDALRVAFGWTNTGPGDSFPPFGSDAQRIAISSGLQVGLASLAMLLFIAVMVWLGRNTDVLRDSTTPTWWRDAKNLRRDIKSTPAKRASILAAYEPLYEAQKEDSYLAMAMSVRRDGSVPELPRLLAIGLAIDGKPLNAVPSSYSLSRVQMAVWFAFTICAGIFLWIISGQLQRIDGSLLALLGISVATLGGAALGNDRNAPADTYYPTKGLFADLVTGFDDTHQVHRYQSVVVNLLLLFVGLSHVLQNLSYPNFDSTWVALLGVSGATFGLGKQFLEKNTDPPAKVADASPPKATTDNPPANANGNAGG